MATNGKKKRAILNLGSVDLGNELQTRMKDCIANDHDLRHVNIRRRRAPWLRKVIEEGCAKSERERNGGK